jgi:hypothetical protein
LKEDGKEIKSEKEVFVSGQLCRKCAMEEIGRDDKRDGQISREERGERIDGFLGRDEVERGLEVSRK